MSHSVSRRGKYLFLCLLLLAAVVLYMTVGVRFDKPMLLVYGGHGGPMPAPDSLEGLLLRCGHALHHGSHGQKDLFAALTQQEQDALRGLLLKLVGSWQEN